MSTATGPRARVRARRSVVACVTAACAFLVMVAVGRVWASAPVHGLVVQGRVEVTGRQAAPVVAGLAVVLLAAAVLIAVAGPRVRVFALVTGALAGAALAVAALGAYADPLLALSEQARGRTGTSGGAALLDDPAVGAWPWVAAGAGIAATVACLAGWSARRTWGHGGRRYERDPVPSAIPDGPPPAGQLGTRGAAADRTHPAPLDALDAWQALSRGDDPTLAG